MSVADLGSISDITALVRSGDVTPAAVFELAAERIAATTPAINAVVTLADTPSATTAAATGPLAGVPFTVKDVIQTRGIRTTAGSLLLADNVPSYDATVVRRLRDAGAVLVGKTNCPEFAMDIHTTNRLFGTTLNPRDVSRTPGGSSGGDSAAVASGCATFGIGTDYGGSIRWPAHCTGLASLRPTAGLVPSTGLLPNASQDPLAAPNSMALRGQVHTLAPIARTIQDVWHVLHVIVGPDGLDARVAPVALGDPEAVDVTQLRCAVVQGEGSVPVRADVLRAVAAAGDVLANRGVDVEVARPPGLDEAFETHKALRHADGLLDVKHLAGGREDLLSDNVRQWIAQAEDVSVSQFQTVAYRRDTLRARILEFLQTRPIWVMPVASLTAFEVPEGRTPQVFKVNGKDLGRYDLLASCWAVSLFGLPAAVVPFGTSDEGIPIGVQIVGRPFADHEVVAVAQLLEDARANG